MAYNGVITNGISEIKVDNVVLGFTEEDSFNWIIDDNTSVINFNVEEQDDPLYTRKTGSKSLRAEFTVADPNSATLTKLFGGASSGNDVIVPGISTILTGVAFVVTSVMGWSINASSVDISSRLADNMGKNSLMGVIVEVTFNAGFTFVAPNQGT